MREKLKVLIDPDETALARMKRGGWEWLMTYSRDGITAMLYQRPPSFRIQF